MIRRFLASLRRRTSSGLYVPELDGLRFVAIACVFTYHIAGDILRHSPPVASYQQSFLFKLTQKLSVGVPLFFVISGMILSLPFARVWLANGEPVRLSSYFLRRLTRLEPPYVATLLIFFVLKTLSGRGRAEVLLPHLLASVSYVHNLVYQQPSSINFVAWSLEVEVQFYLLAPLLTGIFAVRSFSIRRSILCGAVLAFSGLTFLPTYARILDLTVLGNAQYFFVGLLLTDLYLTGGLSRSAGVTWDGISFVGWPLAALGLVFGTPVFRLLLPFVVFLLYVATFKGAKSAKLFSSLALVSVGGMCYSIYLVHNYVIAATGLLTEPFLMDGTFGSRLLLQVALQVWPVLLASIALYKLIEQPCMDPQWPSRLVLSAKTLFRRDLNGARG